MASHVESAQQPLNTDDFGSPLASSVTQSAIPIALKEYLSIVLQQLLHRRNFILEPLLLVRSRPNPNIALDPHHAVLVQHSMTLADDLHHIVPRTFCSSSASTASAPPLLQPLQRQSSSLH